MKFTHELFKRRWFRQFFRFCLVGSLNTLIDFSIYWLLTRVFFVFYLWANIISVAIAMVVAFLLHKHFTFQNKSLDYFGQSLRFFVIGLVGFLLNNFLLVFLIDLGHFYDILAKISATFIVLIWSFLMQKIWTFKEK